MSEYLARQLSLCIFPSLAFFQTLTARPRHSLLQIGADSEFIFMWKFID